VEKFYKTRKIINTDWSKSLDKITITVNKKWLYGFALFAIVVIAIGIYFYWKASTTDKLKITSMRKEGTLAGDYTVFTFTIKVANIGTNDVTGATLVIRLYSDHSEVPIIVGSNTEDLGTIEVGWEITRTLILTVSNYYDIDYAEAIIYLGDRVLDKCTLHF
jgi:hypothetical protein